jgi:hypothetical protein
MESSPSYCCSCAANSFNSTNDAFGPPGRNGKTLQICWSGIAVLRTRWRAMFQCPVPPLQLHLTPAWRSIQRRRFCVLRRWQGLMIMDVLIRNLCRTLLLFWRRRWIHFIRNSRLCLGRLLLLLSKFVEHGVEDGELGSDARRDALRGV